MCKYTKAVRIYRLCPRQPRHQVEQGYYDRCDEAQKPKAYCSDATERTDIARFGSTPVGGPCPTCRDSGISTGTVRIQNVRACLESQFCEPMNHSRSILMSTECYVIRFR
jgi:hypothetical protein